MPKIDPRDVLPQSNLPVPSVPWGRAMQSRLQGVEERVLIDKQDIDGQNRTTAAQLAAISEQLKEISEAQATLSEQQSELSDAQSDITDLLGRVVTARVATSTASNFPVTTSFQTRASTSIPVPSGYNRVAVTATFSIAAAVSSSPPNDYLYGAIRIAGVQSDAIYAQGSWNSSSGHWPNVTTTFARVISNPSGSLSIEGLAGTEVTDWSPNASNRAVITATATFYNE